MFLFLFYNRKTDQSEKHVSKRLNWPLSEYAVGTVPLFHLVNVLYFLSTTPVVLYLVLRSPNDPKA